MKRHVSPLKKRYKTLYNWNKNYHFLLISDDVEILFRKFMLDELTEKDIHVLKDTLELLHRPEYVTARSLESRSLARMVKYFLLTFSQF